MRSLSRSLGLTLAVVCAGLGGGCCHYPCGDESSTAPQHRATAVVCDHLRPTFAAWGLEREPLDSGDGWRSEVIHFQGYDDIAGDFFECQGELWTPERGDSQDPNEERVPLIVVSPILGGALTGYFECRFFCKRAIQSGFASFFLYQDEVLIAPERGASFLERALRRDVRRNIQALDLLLATAAFDPERLGCFGISLGAIRAGLLVAAEPRLRASVLCLGGSDLPSILEQSREGMVRAYFSKRSAQCEIRRQWISSDLRRNLETDPALAAGQVDPAQVMLLLARFDRHVPTRRGWELRQLLGEPETWVIPLGHYSALLVFPWAATRSREFMERCFGDNRQGSAALR